MNEEGTLQGRIEAILYVAGEPVLIRDLAKAVRTEERQLKTALRKLQDEYDYQQRGFVLKLFGNYVQLATRSLYAEDITRLLQPVQQQSLSQAAMETLAVVAYKQPVTRAEIEAVRGVKCDYSIQTLLRKGLIVETGRKDTIGRPALFGTTDAFLSHFGLESLSQLPAMPSSGEEESEIPADNENDQIIP